MINKLNRMKNLVAGLISAFMVLGAVAIAPLEVRANTLPTPYIEIVEDTLSWNAAGAPSGSQIAIYANGDLISTSSALISNLNLRNHFSTGTHSIFVRLTLTNASEGFDPGTTQSNTIHWTPTIIAGMQLATPSGLTVDSNNVLRWTSNDHRATSFRIFANGNAVADVVSNNFWQIDLSLFSEGQNVSFTVMAEAPNLTSSARSSAYTWRAGDATLITPTINVTQTGILTWTGSGAQIVRVYRNGSAMWTSDSAVTQVDLTAHNLPAGSQSIQIRFLSANGNIASNLSNTVTVNLTGQLAAPTGVAVSGTTLSWSAVTNAQGYRIYVGGTARTTTQITGTTFNLATLNLAAGSHNIQVRALGNGTTTLNSSLSSSVNFSPGSVAAPSNLNITNTNLSWNAVSNAVGYRIYVDGTARTTGTEITVTNFNLATLNLGVGSYSVQVRALGNGTTTRDSELSSSINFVVQTIQLEAPTNLSVQGTVLHWSAVPGTRGYTIYVGGVVRSAPTTATHFALGALALPAGSHNVQVRALGNNETTLDSQLSTAVVFTVASQLPPGEQPSPWAQEMVNSAVNAGIVPMHLRSSFTRATTRAEFAALSVALYETVMGTEIVGRMTFNDTNDVNVQKMGHMGVVLGVGGGNFAPNDTLTREQAATMLARLADAMNRPLPAIAANFPDNSSIAPWAIVQVGQMQAAGIMVGADGGMFMPQGPYTREQSIVTLLRLFDIVNR